MISKGFKIGLIIAVIAAAGFAYAARSAGIWPFKTLESPKAPDGCYYHQVQCIRAPCPPELICP